MSPALTRKQKQEKTRSALLQAAAKTFCRRGLANTSVDQVASEAGYTKGAFYANFRSKEELFLVMLDEKFASEIERIDRSLKGGDDPVREARQSTEDFLEFIHGDPEWTQLSFEFKAHAGRDEEFRQELATRQRAFRERLAEVFRRWSADFPYDPPIPLDDVAAITSAMASGFLMEQMIEPEIKDELAGTMMGIFFLGMQASAAGWEPPPKVSSS